MDISEDGSAKTSDTAEPEVAGKATRERSTIPFPYSDLDEAVSVATAIFNNVGPGSCSDDQLAPWMSLSPKSSGYRSRLAAARLFGLLESPTSSTRQLTPLGNKIVDPAQAGLAKSEAFLEVPLFRAVYEGFRGNALPPDNALEAEFHRLGVAKKQTAKARWAFQRSAKTAGYFHAGAGRLVKPGFATTEPGAREIEDPTRSDNAVSEPTTETSQPRKYHLFVEGLLERLPPTGKTWPLKERIAWLNAAAVAFDLLHGPQGSIAIKAKPDESAE